MFLACVMIATVLSGCSELTSNEEVNQILEIAGDQLSDDFSQMKDDIDTLSEYAGEQSQDSKGTFKKVSNKSKGKEINTITKTVTFEADSIDEFISEVNRKEKSLIPITNGYIINANGETEYRGYMIVGKDIQNYKKIAVELPTGPSFGKQETKTVYVNIPETVTYTLHKHEVSNKFTESAIGAFLAGLVNLQFVATQTCDCGYTSQITWEIPDITEMKGQKVTGNEFYIRTEQKVVGK